MTQPAQPSPQDQPPAAPTPSQLAAEARQQQPVPPAGMPPAPTAAAPPTEAPMLSPAAAFPPPPPPSGSRPAAKPARVGRESRVSRRRLLTQTGVVAVVVGVVAALSVWIFAPDRHDDAAAAETPAAVMAPAAAAAAADAAAPDAAGSNAGADAADANSAGTAGDPPAQAAGSTPDLRRGGVFLQSNAPEGNAVVAFTRDQRGKLTEVGRFPTGGTGSGSFEDSAQGLLLATSEGEVSPDQQVARGDLLFSSNAGSSTITVFQVAPDRLNLVDQVPSGGNKPVSLTINHGVLYVLNSGETDNRLILGPTTALENCTTGSLPSLTGFSVDPAGHLTRIPDSTRVLTGAKESGCAQVGYTPDGSRLLVTERVRHLPGQRGKDVGSITSFDVRPDGTLGARQVFDAIGSGPFGFTFTKTGQLLTTEQNGGFVNPGGGHAAAYQPASDGSLVPLGSTIPNSQTDTCWIAVDSEAHLAYTSAPFGGGTIASYRVGEDGLTLLKKSASAPDGTNGAAAADHTADGLTDLALSSDGEFLYQLNSFEGVLYVFMTNPDGSLTFVEQHKVFKLKQFGAGGEAAPFGLAAT